jgi:hypothetical protein
MTTAYVAELTDVVHPLSAVLPDRLEHPVTRHDGIGHHDEQALIGEASQ